MSKLNPKPKKLTLAQALRETSKPLARMGDLMLVQEDKNLSSGQIRDIFLPLPFLPDREGKFERNFKQPVTMDFLNKLYSADDCEISGYLESLTEFSDEALALHFDYRGGFFRDNPFAGDIGDPSRFVSDCKDSLIKIYQPNHDTMEAIRVALLTVHKKDRLAANLGKQHSDDQKKFRENKQTSDEEMHNQWREWQSFEIASNPNFANHSKQAQAVIIKKKHSIPVKAETIAKRLEPIPSTKQK